MPVSAVFLELGEILNTLNAISVHRPMKPFTTYSRTQVRIRSESITAMCVRLQLLCMDISHTRHCRYGE